MTVAYKTGKKKQASFIQGILELGANSHLSKTSRRANDNRLNPAQENAQALPLARRVKAAHYCHAWCQCGFNEIVSL
jgi:hypothetical protein